MKRMFEPIKGLIKTDDESLLIFRKFEKRAVNRATVMSVLMAMNMLISIFFVIYSVNIKEDAEIEINKLEKQNYELQRTIDNYKEKTTPKISDI